MGLALGAEIERLRNAKRLRQQDLAVALGHQSNAQVSRYETGEVTPKPKQLAVIAETLGVPLSHFDQFGGAHDVTAPRETRRQRERQRTQIDPAAQLRTIIRTRQDEILEKAGPRNLAFWLQLIDILEKHPDRERALYAALEGVLDKLDAEQDHDPPKQASGGRHR